MAQPRRRIIAIESTVRPLFDNSTTFYLLLSCHHVVTERMSDAEIVSLQAAHHHGILENYFRAKFKDGYPCPECLPDELPTELEPYWIACFGKG